jgi:hypothetical protein
MCVAVELQVHSSSFQSEAPAPGRLTLETILTPKEFMKYQSKTGYKDRMDLFRKALSDRARQLRGHLKARRMEHSMAALKQIEVLAQYASAEPSRRVASPKDLRSNQVRKLEIRIRKMLDTLYDSKLSIPSEYRSQFDSTAEDLQQLRKQLLHQVFQM